MVRPVADERKMEPKIDIRIQGIPHAAVEQEDERTREVRRLVHQVKNHPKRGSLVKHLQKICTYIPFSEQHSQLGERGVL